MGFRNISIEGSDTASDFNWEIGRCGDKEKQKKLMTQEAKEDHGKWNTPGFVNVALCLVDGNGVKLLDYPWDQEWHDFITKLVDVIDRVVPILKKENPGHTKILVRLFKVLKEKVDRYEVKENQKNS